MTDRMSRQSYVSSEQYDIEELVNAIGSLKYITCEKLFEEIKKNSKILEAPNLGELFQGNALEAAKLFQICFEPQALKITNTSQPYIAKHILTMEPRTLLTAVLDDTQHGKHIFDFLKRTPNQTVLGYFSAVMDSVESEIQQKVHTLQTQIMQLLNRQPQILKLIYSKAHLPQIFNFLFRISVYSPQIHLPQAIKFLSTLLNLIDEDKLQQHSENTLYIMEEISKNYKQLMKDTYKHRDEQQSLHKFCRRVYDLSKSCWTEEYMNKLVKYSIGNIKKKQYICQNLVKIMGFIVDLYKNMPSIAEKLQIEYHENPLEKCIISLLRSMSWFIDILKEQPTKQRMFSSGEDVRCIGMMRLNILEMLQKVLELEPKVLLTHFDINRSKILSILQMYITINPWNNIVHHVVQKIVIGMINSFDRYRELSQDYTGPNGFLGFLIESFRNHQYIFLSSGLNSHYGYLHSLYNIAKAVIIKLNQSKNLKTIMDRFEPWNQFVLKDLQEYEQSMSKVLGGKAPRKNGLEQQKYEWIKTIVVDLNKGSSESTETEMPQEIDDKFIQVDTNPWLNRKSNLMTAKRRHTVEIQTNKLLGSDRFSLSPTKVKKASSTSTQLVEQFEFLPQKQDKIKKMIEQSKNEKKQIQQMMAAVIEYAFKKKTATDEVNVTKEQPKTEDANNK